MSPKTPPAGGAAVDELLRVKDRTTSDARTTTETTAPESAGEPG